MMDDIELRIEEVKRLRSLLSKAVSYLHEVDDEGPADSGWQSQRLSSLIAEIEYELG